MATIKDIHVRAFEKWPDGTIRNPRFRRTVMRSLLVFVETDDGRIGHGECWVDGGTPNSLIAFIRGDLRFVPIAVPSARST